jgi:hypothetical protein
MIMLPLSGWRIVLGFAQVYVLGNPVGEIGLMSFVEYRSPV